MSVLRKVVESRRNELINKLIECDQFKKDGKHLFELTLSELEYEYFRIHEKEHPHSGYSSIKWRNFK
jgi:hypothetical protein